jgi:hypothetical protein
LFLVVSDRALVSDAEDGLLFSVRCLRVRPDPNETSAHQSSKLAGYYVKMNLRQIARELVIAVRKNVTIDWTVKGSARAKLRVIVRRLLRKHGYPPDKQEKATQTVLEQAELLCGDIDGIAQSPVR